MKKMLGKSSKCFRGASYLTSFLRVKEITKRDRNSMSEERTKNWQYGKEMIANSE